MKLFVIGKNQSLALQLVRCLWDTLVSLDCTEIQLIRVINEPSQVIFIAAEVGNCEIIVELAKSYPDLPWEVNDKNQSIFHIAVLYRHAAIFNLIHEIRSIRNFVVTYEDADQNNLLHCAAKLAPPNQLNLMSGAAFQMMHELRWYEVSLPNLMHVAQPSVYFLCIYTFSYITGGEEGDATLFHREEKFQR